MSALRSIVSDGRRSRSGGRSLGSLVPRTCMVTTRSVRREPPESISRSSTAVRDRDADHAGRALSARLGGDPAERGLARVVDALREVAQLLVRPAREHALHGSPLLPARDDVVDARGSDDAEREVARLRELPVVLRREVGEHGLDRRRSTVDANRCPDGHVLDRAGRPVMAAGGQLHADDSVRAEQLRFLLEPPERPAARGVPRLREHRQLLRDARLPAAHAPGLCCHPTW